MQELLRLLQKFSEGSTSTDEKRSLLEELDTKKEMLKNRMEGVYAQDIIQPSVVFSKERSDKLFEKILATINKDSVIEQTNEKAKLVIFSRTWVRWAAAACLVATIAFLSVRLTGRNNTFGEKVIAQQSEIRLQELRNETNHSSASILADGTMVVLAPHSAISFYAPFDKSRDISIRGMADFKVAKDPAKPFIVYANGISTTALGTEFSVNTNDNRVEVKLIEGKVVVRSVNGAIAMKDTYLKPGEQISIDQQSGNYALTQFMREGKRPYSAVSDQKRIFDDKSNINNAALVFNKTSLAEVFTKVGDKFNVLIQFGKNDLGRLTFTGSFLNTDSLPTILEIICNTNDLQHSLQKGIVVITKQ